MIRKRITFSESKKVASVKRSKLHVGVLRIKMPCFSLKITRESREPIRTDVLNTRHDGHVVDLNDSSAEG